MTTKKRKYAEGDIVLVYGEISCISKDEDDDFPYEIDILDHNMIVIGSSGYYFSDDNIIKKLSQSEINKVNVAQQQKKIKELEDEINERQAKIKAIESSIKPAIKPKPKKECK